MQDAQDVAEALVADAQSAPELIAAHRLSGEGGEHVGLEVDGVRGRAGGVVLDDGEVGVAVVGELESEAQAQGRRGARR